MYVWRIALQTEHTCQSFGFPRILGTYVWLSIVWFFMTTTVKPGLGRNSCLPRMDSSVCLLDRALGGIRPNQETQKSRFQRLWVSQFGGSRSIPNTETQHLSF
ncbi:hypothetical protein N24_2085 [Corynebacterium suranareeae]|uniref:Uncharacterized protein n=1 Tax=Corynebacterium suranareeae TaxID=2506452 RepID=A0A160PQG7_9CORY|nr:hypothetical protein N24_2085 [Corynebacterium suranareeae]